MDVELDAQLQRRIEGALHTVRNWDADIELLAACRRQIPIADLRNDPDPLHDGEQVSNGTTLTRTPTARFIQRLAKYFKSKMTWINKPPCRCCGQIEQMEPRGTRGPVTQDERDGDAQRVEVYHCPICAVETTFPRYNSVRKLLETHAGRCGEYANLFGLYCRSLGLDTRYILDVTDHVWTEVRFFTDEVPSLSAPKDCNATDEPWWCMIDSCEGVVDEPSMYEAGWGKQLSLIMAVSTTSVIDVTAKYSRQLGTPDFQARRRASSTSEVALQRVMDRVNGRLLEAVVASKERQRIESSRTHEAAQLGHIARLKAWKEDDDDDYQNQNNGRQQIYREGRISGSMDWKLLRHEAGSRRPPDTNTNATSSSSADTDLPSTSPDHSSICYIEESFYPYRRTAAAGSTSIAHNDLPSLDIIVQPPATTGRYANGSYGIVVNGVACSVMDKLSLSVVVLDHLHLGCILQSRRFSSLLAFVYFVETLPAHRIVIALGRLPSSTNHEVESETDSLKVKRVLSELGDFNEQNVYEGIVYVGQVLANPDWSFCSSYKDAPLGISLCLAAKSMTTPLKTEAQVRDDCKLWTTRGIRSKSVIGRLGDSAMLLEKQLQATFAQKRQAFQSYLQTEADACRCFGFTTRTGSPVYLLGETAYPFKLSMDGWYTCLLLPSGLVPDDTETDVTASLDATTCSGTQFDVPLDDSFFTLHLGDRLLLNGTTLLPTTEILHNTRLVGLYFSAHWCPPCRKFTPLLSEMYRVLKEAYPVHGLEIVFVSSDRDAASFTSYFGSMPWLAVPFDSLAALKSSLFSMYNVSGIPAFVVLDSLSGQVVVSNQESRQHVTQACRSGDGAITSMFDSWLKSVPAESIQLLGLMSLSCQPNQQTVSSTVDGTLRRDYMVRSDFMKRENRTHSLITEFMAEGMEREEAIDAALAVEEAAYEPVELEAGPLNGVLRLNHEPERVTPKESDISSDDETLVISTASKYLSNCIASPWTVKYRHIRLGFKAVDKITSVVGGLTVLESLGFQIYCVADDYVACIPVYADLDEMSKGFAKLTSVSSS